MHSAAFCGLCWAIKMLPILMNTITRTHHGIDTIKLPNALPMNVILLMILCTLISIHYIHKDGHSLQGLFLLFLLLRWIAPFPIYGRYIMLWNLVAALGTIVYSSILLQAGSDETQGKPVYQ